MITNPELLTFITIISLEIIFFIVWLVRLEGRVNYVERAGIETQKDVDTLRVEHQAVQVKIIEELAKVRETLAKLEGFLLRKDKE